MPIAHLHHYIFLNLLTNIFILTCDRVGSGQILLDTISTSAIEGNRPIELGATVKNQEHIVEFIND